MQKDARYVKVGREENIPGEMKTPTRSYWESYQFAQSCLQTFGGKHRVQNESTIKEEPDCSS